MAFVEILFWVAVAVVVYTYVGYGIILWMMVKVKEWFIKPVTLPHPTDEELPEMTLFITAYNEEQVVD